MMRAELFWPLAFCGFAAVSLVCGIVAWPMLSAAWPSIEEKIDQFRRQPPLVKLVLLLFVGAFVVYGSTKTNLVDQTSGTNIIEIVDGGTNVVEIVEGGTNGVGEIEFEGGTNDVDQVKGEGEGEQRNLPTCSAGQLELEGNILCSPSPITFTSAPQAVTPEDIVRGWQLWEVRTNCNVSYAMPAGATLATNWWVRGAYEDCSIVRLGDCSIGGSANQSNNPNNRTMSFPFGTNEYDSAWAFSWGKLRFVLGDALTEIVAVGAPMSAVPYRSRLWSAADTNGAMVVTWENFVLGREPLTANGQQLTAISAQIELRPNGDFVTRSNEVETVWHRIDDFDWDGDGIVNEDDRNPYCYDGDCTGQDEWAEETIDWMVGAGEENGYYKLTATFPEGFLPRTVLSVGDEKVVVAGPGTYAFLLEKGDWYELGLEPFVEGVEFAAVDDIPAEAPMRLGGVGPILTGGWSSDEGRLVLEPPGTNGVGCVLWTPKLRVTPSRWLHVNSEEMRFEAVLADRTSRMDEPTYLWTPCNEDLYVNTPDGESTEMTWYGREFVAGLLARLDVCVAGEWLESELLLQILEIDGPVIDPHGPLAHASFDFSAPEALLVNSNEVSDAKVGSVRMRFEGMIPSDGTLSLRCRSGGDLVRLLGDSSWTVTSNEVARGWTASAYIEGVAASAALGDIRLDAVFECDGEEHICGSAALTVVGIGGVDFPDEPDGLPVVPPDTSVAVGLEVFPDAARPLLWVEYDVRRLQEDGTFTDWGWEGDGEPDTQEGYVWSPEGGVCQVRATAGFWSSECPSGTDRRDCWRDTARPAYVYVPREPHLVFDYDRDGVIGTNDVAKAKDGNTTFRFWINDDNDSGDVCAATDYCSDAPGQSTKNCQDGQVNGRRDLLDFTPVWMDFSNVFPTGTPAQVWNKVEWRIWSTCVNVVWSNLGRNNAGAFQREGDQFEFGSQLYDLAECADVVNIFEDTVIPYSLRGTAETEGGVFLIEGRDVGFDLVMEGWTVDRLDKPSEWLVTSEANISVSDVEDMYRWKNLRNVCGDVEGHTSHVNSPWNHPDSECDGRHFVFVHGFNVNSEEARASAAEVFKRLWQSGSDSMFTAVEWYGNQEQTDIVEDYQGTISLNYYANALHAFETAPSLVSTCAALPGRKVMIAHSLGNMLVSSAAVDHGLVYDRYYMLNAAVAMEAYDSTEQAADMVDSTWAANSVPAAYRASRWSGLFGPEDFRSKLTWRGRFAGITNAVNCYSETEDVVGNPRQAFTVLGETSWVMQEYLKGDSRLHAINLIPGSHISCEGGWGRNAHYPLWLTTGSMLGLSDLTREDVIEHPLFTPFRNETERMSSTNLLSVTDTAATPELRARFLADAIPAESHAAGANYLGALGENGNLRMDVDARSGGYMANYDRWPEKDRDDNSAWKHSSFKQTAYFFTYKLYDYFVKGN